MSNLEQTVSDLNLLSKELIETKNQIKILEEKKKCLEALLTNAFEVPGELTTNEYKIKLSEVVTRKYNPRETILHLANNLFIDLGVGLSLLKAIEEVADISVTKLKKLQKKFNYNIEDLECESKTTKRLSVSEYFPDC